MMLKRVVRLFTIKTRFEAYLVIFAIAMGAVTRGIAYLGQYPGTLGVALCAGCLGVVFVAGAKLLDAVRPAEPAIVQGPYQAPTRHLRSASLRRRHRRRSSDRRRVATLNEHSARRG
ncbi:hypothetical protein [Sphingomicrobium sediminis]|uniref:hypothetical protein n=1 Tax=Sphingomicrobium sediminis TaxID=2950949 RepID=UPI00313448B1